MAAELVPLEQPEDPAPVPAAEPDCEWWDVPCRLGGWVGDRIDEATTPASVGAYVAGVGVAAATVLIGGALALRILR